MAPPTDLSSTEVKERVLSSCHGLHSSSGRSDCASRIVSSLACNVWHSAAFLACNGNADCLQRVAQHSIPTQVGQWRAAKSSGGAGANNQQLEWTLSRMATMVRKKCGMHARKSAWVSRRDEPAALSVSQPAAPRKTRVRAMNRTQPAAAKAGVSKSMDARRPMRSFRVRARGADRLATNKAATLTGAATGTARAQARLRAGAGTRATRPGAACEPPACYQMPAGHSFLHIPKTGGTSFEKSAASLGIEVLISPWTKWAGTRQPLKGEGAPWHLPPDMFEARHRTPRSPAGKPLLCIVRNPADRLRSEVAWRCALAKKERRFFTFWTYNSKSDRCTLQQSPVTFMAREARQVLQADRRSSLHFADDRVLHMLPQSW